MLEEDGVLRCCLYVLVPSAAKKTEEGLSDMTVRGGGRDSSLLAEPLYGTSGLSPEVRPALALWPCR